MFKQVSKPECTFRSLQDCARNYAESPKTGKEFWFRKVRSLFLWGSRSQPFHCRSWWGWTNPKLLMVRHFTSCFIVVQFIRPHMRTHHPTAVNQIINSTGHSTNRRVYFTVTKSAIKVRPNTLLMPMLTNKFIMFLLWIVLVWPFIWLYRRFGRPGGKWDVCRAEYAFDRDPRDSGGNGGDVRLGDGDWVKIWERTLRLAVGNRIQSSSPIYRPTENDSNLIRFN
jgi:hypothetical protein